MPYLASFLAERSCGERDFKNVERDPNSGDQIGPIFPRLCPRFATGNPDSTLDRALFPIARRSRCVYNFCLNQV